MKKSFLRLISLLVIVCTICFQLIGCVTITGPQGPKGDKGEQGPMGAMGFAGHDGADGKDGLSAYQIAVLNGFEGSEQEWLASLVGKDGSSDCDHRFGEWVAISDSSYNGTVYIRGCTICYYSEFRYSDKNFGGNANKERVNIWVSEFPGSVELAKAQIAEFLALNPDVDVKYEFVVSGVTEVDAASRVLADVAQAPDIYCFAQDQLARLVQADALAKPGVQATANVKAANDSISVSAASIADTLYAYPLTSDNGYYMYYDTSVITNPDDLAQIVADCEAAGKYICYELENAWYTASFFMATGCVNNWTMNENGKFTSVEDTYNSEAGIAAMKGMQIVTKSDYYVNASYDFYNAGIVVTGIWNANTAEEVLGENFAVTDLPSFTVDGESYHLASFSGNKLMGVKPQADAEKVAMLHKLAQYLTNTECQLERYEELQWGPSNLEAQASDVVKSNPHFAALALQNQYAVPQGYIHGGWWDVAKLLGCESRNAVTVEDLWLALDTYEATVEGLLTYDY